MATRLRSLSTLLGLLVFLASSPVAASAQSASFEATGPLTTARFKHASVQLANGRILITGGQTESIPIVNAEIYDPAAGTFSPTSAMKLSRNLHTATLLPNGKVLIAGGNTFTYQPTPTATAEIFDPTTGTFAMTGSMSVPRQAHTATLLYNGKVLIAGGSSWTGSVWMMQPSAEIYDPSTGLFTAAGTLFGARDLHTATPLGNGKVLVAGGRRITGTTYPQTSTSVATAELYDPATNSFSVTGAMSTVRSYHSATLLPNGKVLVAGGNQRDAFNGPPTASADLYDPATGTFAATGAMAAGREHHSAVRLGSGRVLLIGGRVIAYDGVPRNSASTEVYDPLAGTFSAGPAMSTTRTFFTATSIDMTGRVLVAGGQPGAATGTTSAEVLSNPVTCY